MLKTRLFEGGGGGGGFTTALHSRQITGRTGGNLPDFTMV